MDRQSYLKLRMSADKMPIRFGLEAAPITVGCMAVNFSCCIKQVGASFDLTKDGLRHS